MPSVPMRLAAKAVMEKKFLVFTYDVTDLDENQRVNTRYVLEEALRQHMYRFPSGQIARHLYNQSAEAFSGTNFKAWYDQLERLSGGPLTPPGRVSVAARRRDDLIERLREAYIRDTSTEAFEEELARYANQLSELIDAVDACELAQALHYAYASDKRTIDAAAVASGRATQIPPGDPSDPHDPNDALHRNYWDEICGMGGDPSEPDVGIGANWEDAFGWQSD